MRRHRRSNPSVPPIVRKYGPIAAVIGAGALAYQGMQGQGLLAPFFAAFTQTSVGPGTVAATGQPLAPGQVTVQPAPLPTVAPRKDF